MSKEIDILACAEREKCGILDVISKYGLSYNLAARQLSFESIQNSYNLARKVREKRDCIDLFFHKLAITSNASDAKLAHSHAMVSAVKRECLNSWADFVDTKDECKDFYVLNSDCHPSLCGIVVSKWREMLKVEEDYVDFLETVSNKAPIWIETYRAIVNKKPSEVTKDKLFALASESVEAMKIALDRLY